LGYDEVVMVVSKEQVGERSEEKYEKDKKSEIE